MSIAKFAVTRRVTVAMLAAAIIVLGIFSIPRLAVALLPSFTPPVVSVTVNYGTVAPETMETTVTRPIENAVSRVSGIDVLQSISFEGQTTVRAQFKFGTDINVAAVDIQQQVARIRGQLPNDPLLQEPQIQKADPNSLPVVRIQVTDSTRTLRDLSDLLANQVADEFSAVTGVGSVGVSGGQTRAINVEPNSAVLAGYGLTNSAIINKIKAENVDSPAGVISIGSNEYGVRTSALYKNAAEIGNTIITIKNGAPVYLRDVATVRDGILEQRIISRLSGQPSVALIVTAQPDANVVAVAQGVYAKVADLQHRYPTMKFGILFDQRGFITDAIDALEHTAIYGAVLAILIILLFLHSWRSTLIVSVSLPISVLGTLFAAYIFHQSLNVMTLGGLALAVGLIVDDAVVVIENIYRHLAMGESAREAAERATAQIFTAVLASTITVVTVFVPLLLIPGLQGLIFGPLAIVVMTGVTISLLVAVTTVPMLSSFMLKNEAHGSSKPVSHGAYARFSAAFDRGYERIESSYKRFLGWALDRPALIVGTGFLLFIATLGVLKLGVVATESFPAADSRYARLDIRLPNGTGLAKTDGVSRLVEAAVAQDPRVEQSGATVGAGYGGGFSRTITNQISISIVLKPGIYGDKATQFVNDWQRRLGGSPRTGGTLTPEQQAAFAKITPERRAQFRALRRALIGSTVRGRTIDIVQQSVSQGSDSLAIQIIGPDNNVDYRLAVGAIPALAQIPGVIRPDTNVTPSNPEIDVRIDRRRAAQLGFSTVDISNEIATATSGSIASYFQVNGIQYPILIELPASDRRSLASLSGLLLTPPTVLAANGAGNASSLVTNSANAAAATTSQSFGSITLGSLAAIKTGLGPSQITRQNKQRRVDIDATVIGRPLGAVLADATRIMNDYPFPAGYRWQYGPEITQSNDTFSALTLVVLLAVALIYMLLASQFESFIDPLIIMMSVPLSIVGIVGSLWITHRSFGLTAFIGALMLVGIAVKNAILVVEFTKQLRAEGFSPRDALLQAGPLRLRPILMTTLATLGGMLPLALGIEAGSSTQAPLGTVVIGGLVTSTLLSLIVVPTIYLWVARTIEPRFEAQPPSHRPARTTRGGAQEPQPVGV